jgi:hypothetical protein
MPKGAGRKAFKPEINPNGVFTRDQCLQPPIDLLLKRQEGAIAISFRWRSRN